MDNGFYRIGILGGTFDPIHFGHLIFAQTAYEAFKLDFVLIMPAHHPYFKEGSKVTPGEQRCEMVKLAILGDDHFRFSDLEFSIEGNSYTADTLELVKNEYPNSKLFFIMGSDTLFDIETWKDPHRIFKTASILSSKRDVSDKAVDEQISYLKDKYKAEIFNLKQPNIEISSSDIRNKVSNGLSIKYYTPDSVIDYIKENNLYK